MRCIGTLQLFRIESERLKLPASALCQANSFPLRHAAPVQGYGR